MEKLVQKVKWEFPNSVKTEMYIYGEADMEQNMAMQEPLGRLYHYENQSSIEEKIKEYIKTLDMKINRLKFLQGKADSPYHLLFRGMREAIAEVRDDLWRQLRMW